MNHLFNPKHKIIEFNQAYTYNTAIISCSNRLILRLCDIEDKGQMFDMRMVEFTGTWKYIVICAN